MVRSRKTTAARSKPARAGSKSVRPVRAAASSKPKVPSKSARPKVVPGARKPGAKPQAPRTAPAKVASKTPSKAGPAGKTSAPAGATKRTGAKVKLSDARRAAQAEVRPLGVLPPESMARSTRSAPLPAARPRPVSPRATPISAQGAKKLTEQELKEFEGRLLDERRRILKEMGHLETTVLKVNQRDSSGDLSGYSFHMADAGTDAMEREKAFLFASAEGRVLLEIDDALRRLYRGDYGSCENCGNAIARARLEVMPQARLCISCKEKEEREQRGAM